MLLLRTQNLDPYDFFHHPDVVCLAVDHTLQILQAIPDVLHLTVVEICRVGCALLNKEPGANVDEHMRRGGKTARDVERGCEWDEERLVGGARVDALRYRIDAVAELRLRRSEGLEGGSQVFQLAVKLRLQFLELWDW